MRIRNAVHGGLNRFAERNDTSGLLAAMVEKVRYMLSFLPEMAARKGCAEFPAGGRIVSRTTARGYGT